MKKVIAIGLLAAGVAAALIWQLGTSGSGRGDPLVNKIAIDIYKGEGLGPDEQPSGYVKNAAVVALVAVEQVKEPLWNTHDGTMPSSLLSRGTDTSEFTFVYTPVLVRVDSYIKGGGPDTLVVSQIGGARDGITTELENGYEAFSPGMRAVVFLNPPGMNISGWTLENAYVITGNKAYSKWDAREMPVESLLSQLRDAAGATNQ